MRRRVVAIGTALFVALSVSAVQAGKVTVKGVHLCCGQCLKAVGGALHDVDGVSGASCDRDAKTVTFEAASADAAEAGVKALAKAGFHGSASHGDKKVDFPDSGAKKGEKADSVTVTGVHLCCGQCVKAVAKALDGVDGKTGAKCDRKAKTVTVTGNGIEVLAVVNALNKAGFHGTVKK